MSESIPTIEEIIEKYNAAVTELEAAGIPDKTAADSAHAAQISQDAAQESAESASESALQADGLVLAHAEDTSLHLTTQDRIDFNHINSLFHPVIHPGSVITPEEAVPDEWFASYFARNASPIHKVAPGYVYVSRVPFARKATDGSWINTGSAIDATRYQPEDIKLLDNTGLQHKCSTDVTENPDDYVGKQWAFYWARCNYMRDAYGVKWITAVEGESIGLPNGTTAVFDPKKPTGAFGPAIWAFCTLDKLWNIDADDIPNFQLWGIGDSPWENLSTDRKNWLEQHGVTSSDYCLWSTAKWYNGTEWKPRSYIVDSAYCGTAEVDATNTLTGISSKLNEPLVNSVSHNTINNLLGNKFGGGARACALAMIFDIVKNATKNSQTIHYGMANNNQNGIVASANLLNPGYVFPIASKGNFEVGCTVYIRTTLVNAQSTTYKRSVTNQIGRIKAIENREVEVITSADPTVESPTTEIQTKLCLVIDENTVEPFYVRTTTANATALTSLGYYACAYATQGIMLAGETTVGGVNGTGVIGKHDGYISGTNGRHPYRVQGMEMMGGIYQCAADAVVLKGTRTVGAETGGTAVTLPDGMTYYPTTAQYVYLYAPSNVVHKLSGSLSAYITGGYIPVGIGTTTAGYIYNGFVDTHYGVWYITDTGASDHTGHADNSYMGASPAEYLSGGGLNYSAAAGSAYLNLIGGLGNANWTVGARD